ncbi:MAG: type II toxin-antitoxin system HicB family antitoxin [Elusimicrobia bacterium]|nr:type II toxin-antitoxin system HicB family antitoxin [Elusimicrobiota bacterium]MDE2314490.1 type II toxin-antitoxin system HicB family antitoxin [Elusimicrobiota bacterium]
MTRRFTAIVEKDSESGLYIGLVPGIPGAHTQAASLDELGRNLKEVLSLCLEEAGQDSAPIPEFVGTQLIEVQA